jgi:hypothetical protein
MRRTAVLLASAIAAFVHPGSASARGDEQLWTAASATVKLSEPWRVSQELVARFSNDRNGLYEIEGTTMLGYRPVKDVTVAVGYVHNPQFADGDHTLTERRAREQVTVDNIAQIGGGRLSARLRFEQRWRKAVDETGHRVRPFVRFSLPLRGKTTLTLSNETFVNLNETPFQRQGGLDRMRNMIAVSTPLSAKANIEAGYLNQHAFVRGGEDNSDHVASVSLSLNL